MKSILKCFLKLMHLCGKVLGYMYNNFHEAATLTVFTLIKAQFVKHVYTVKLILFF